jgi:hypothetical protein
MSHEVCEHLAVQRVVVAEDACRCLGCGAILYIRSRWTPDA